MASYQYVYVMKDLTKAFPGGREVFKGITLSFLPGVKIGVLGVNGAGKSSLLRCLAGVQEPTTGTVEPGINVALGYFAQEHEQVDLTVTVLDNIDDRILTTESERRALLGSFGLVGDVAHQMPRTLSGGERAKLGLAMLAAGQANLLILDEPTNNLDPSSIEAVGQMLAEWPGTVVVVSHDRVFLDRTVIDVLALDGEGGTRQVVGGIAGWLQQRGKQSTNQSSEWTFSSAQIFLAI